MKKLSRVAVLTAFAALLAGQACAAPWILTGKPYDQYGRTIDPVPFILTDIDGSQFGTSANPVFIKGVAGTALMGKVGIDQTTPGTTNGVQVNAALPAGSNIIGNVRIDQTTAGTTNGVVTKISPFDSYRVSVIGNASYATPTDLAGICGVVGKTVLIRAFIITAHSTVGVLFPISFIHRSTVDTGGTSTNLTGTPDDSASPAATAVPLVFTAAPTLGTSLGTVYSAEALTGTLTAAPGQSNMGAIMPLGSTVTPEKPYTLRGVNDCLYANAGGAALPAGFANMGVHILWIEF